jgi:2,3-bisphosphoglycerate-dependent phosphoglycerate mutase
MALPRREGGPSDILASYWDRRSHYSGNHVAVHLGIERMTVFHLVRHAHADWSPDAARPLSPQGRTDAVRVAEILAPYPIAAIYSSPERRARETVEPLADCTGVRIEEVQDLRERVLGSAPADDFGQAVKACWDDPAFSYPGGESNLAAGRRGAAVIHDIGEKHQDAHVVIATHGNLMALILQGFDAMIGYDFWRSLTMPDIYRLEVTPGGQGAIRRLWPCSTAEKPLVRS